MLHRQQRRAARRRRLAPDRLVRRTQVRATTFGSAATSAGGPSAISAPRSRTATRSATPITAGTSCSIQSAPGHEHAGAQQIQQRLALRAVRPESGSSSKSTAGSSARARARSSRRCCPGVGSAAGRSAARRARRRQRGLGRLRARASLARPPSRRSHAASTARPAPAGEQQVVEHRQLAEKLEVLERPPDAEQGPREAGGG